MTGNTFAPQGGHRSGRLGDLSGRSARGSAIRKVCLRPGRPLRKRGYSFPFKGNRLSRILISRGVQHEEEATMVQAIYQHL